jgi:hypothetical protein
MPVGLSPPAASEVSVDTLFTPSGRSVDPAFEERWNAWVARGRQHDLAVRRKLRFLAIALVIGIVLVIVGLRLWGGSL